MSSSQPSHSEGGSAGLKLIRKDSRFTRGQRLVMVVGFTLLGITIVVNVVLFPGQGIQTNATIFGSEAEAWVALAIFVEGWFSYQNWLRGRDPPMGTTGPPTTPPPGSSVPPDSLLGPAGEAPSLQSKPDQMNQNLGGEGG